MISHYPALNYLKISHFPPYFMYHFHNFCYLLNRIVITKKSLYSQYIILLYFCYKIRIV